MEELLTPTLKTARKNAAGEVVRFQSEIEEDKTEKLINIIKSEGLLLRNKGTNSIHSMKIKMDKFEEVLNTISKSLKEQTFLMKKL